MHKGKVIIAGAGPGDPELITLKAAKYLHEADVILTDRLVSKDIIAAHASVFAKIILVGKDGCKSERSVTQKEINHLLVKYTMQGNLVVRLKGGDVAFFSNVLDELQTLVENKISYEIIPGITAASGASAFAGIPLTARNHAQGVRFITYSAAKNREQTHDWTELAQTTDTLVFYMAGASWKKLAGHFIENNVAHYKKIAIIEQATTPYQKVTVYDFKDITNAMTGRGFASPSLVVIGSVVNFHQKFSWKKETALSGSCFSEATRNAIKKDTIQKTA